jgi:hypothetical protein
MLSSLTAGGNLTILHLWVYSDRTAMGIIQHVGHREMGVRASMAPDATARSAGTELNPLSDLWSTRGLGLGLAYIIPIATLVKRVPDRRGRRFHLFIDLRPHPPGLVDFSNCLSRISR